MNKDILIQAIHKIYRKDKWLNDLFRAAGVELEYLKTYADEIEAQYFTDTATWNLDIMERDLGLTENKGKEIADRRSAIIAKWRTSGKVDIALLQAVADAWKNGEVEVEFLDGKIQIHFTGEFGIPNDLDGLKNAIENTKPAHLAVIYAFRYLLIKDIHNVLTIDEMQALKTNQFAGRTV